MPMNPSPTAHRLIRPVARLKAHFTQEGIPGDSASPFPAHPRGAMTPRKLIANAYGSPPWYYVHENMAIAIAARSASNDCLSTIPVLVIPADPQSIHKLKVRVASAMAHGPDAVLAIFGLKVKP